MSLIAFVPTIMCPFCQEEKPFIPLEGIDRLGIHGHESKMRCTGCRELWWVSSKVVHTATSPIELSERNGRPTLSMDGTS